MKTDSMDVLVDRPDEALDITKIMQTIVNDERSRRRWNKFLTVAPWLISGVFGMFAVGAGVVVARRPMPTPLVEVAIYRSDGTLEAPVDRGELSPDRKKFIIRSDLQNFVVAWESYAWLANQSYYNRVSAMTAGEGLQTSYQESWHKRSQENRDQKYGKSVTRNVAAIQTSYVPRSPFMVSARFLVKLTTLQSGSTCEWWSADLTFKQDNNTIPLDKQLAYDPSDVIVVSYFSTPADPNARPWPC